MFDIAEFHLVGRIGSIKIFDNLVRVSVAANGSYKKEGIWIERTHWNEVVIFDQGTRDYVEQNFSKGDYICTRGTVRQNNYMKGDEQVYTTELIVDQISRLPVKRATPVDHLDDEPAREPAKRATAGKTKAKAPAVASNLDGDIPF
ncbi:MAG: single-stranded DNA-binding protein [Hyphomicrobiales bacterium]|nr:single-stranded DNA-binding protein [Hyphomicrobiales bacterium]MDE2116234.1 single-stranded DNA-binding protein [Hyphomicrobiales bacterium]